ncbi:MAG: hypothetical protein KKG47_14020 [Proteobacteria bacterium]|nr:hypothetical protein [Pseudomonadota bacterium]MBU1737684.1 hypothetical protein [Pseudomonadota bacterium]
MKRLVAILVSLVMVVSLAACDKQPVAEIEAAKASLEAAASDGSEVFVAEDFRKVNEAMAAAMDEVKVQDGKMFKNYDKANEMLAGVMAEAQTVKAKAIAERERLRLQSVADLESARTAVVSTRELLNQAPAGKGSAADIMVMKADLSGLEATVVEIQAMVTAGDYSEASERALSVKEKAGAISTEIEAALAKKLAAQGKAKKK